MKQPKESKQPKKPKTKVKKIDPLEPLKLEVAAELGLLEQIKSAGWHSLSAKEAGKIGGLMTQRLRRSRERMDLGVNTEAGGIN